jgi:hypothetical protein
MEVIFKIRIQASVVGRVTSLWVGLDDGGIAVNLLAETKYSLFRQCLNCLLGLPNRLFNWRRRLFPRGHSDGWCETVHSPQLYLHHFISSTSWLMFWKEMLVCVDNTKNGHTYFGWAKRRIFNVKAGIEDYRILEYDAVLFCNFLLTFRIIFLSPSSG